MNALKPRPPFHALVMSEESRLGREQIQTAFALQQITDAGVRVFFYLTDQERKLDTAIEKIMGALAGFASEMEREKTSQRVHDALRKKAAALQVTGCRVYGYDNLEVLGPTGERLHVVRRINRDEAAIVRRLFERYVAGDGGLATIAKELNGEGVPPPRGHRRGWAPSCVRAILHRELYRGMVVWNKTQAIMRRGTKTSRKRPKADWLRFDAPDLRIIPEELWERVDRKIRKTRHAFARTANGRLCGHPSGADLRSAYLLSGLAKCAICGGSLVAYKRKRGDGKDLYICVFHHKLGPAVCTNDHRIHQQTLDSALLHALKSVLDEQMIADAVRRALAEIRAGQTQFPDQRLALERQLSLVEARLRHLVEAIATGKATDAIYSELHKEEAEKKTLTGQLDNLEKLVRIISLDATRIERDLRARIADLKGLLGKHVPQTRQMLRKLLDGPILCTPFTDARGKGYEVTATGSYAGLFRVPVAVNDGGGEGGI
jgi:DNA invertase Pin-like site-specific DNA recombinase